MKISQSKPKFLWISTEVQATQTFRHLNIELATK